MQKFVTLHTYRAEKSDNCQVHRSLQNCGCPSIMNLRHVLFLQLNQRDALIYQIYLRNRNVHVSDRFTVHLQECSTVYTAIRICHTGYADCLLAGSG